MAVKKRTTRKSKPFSNAPLGSGGRFKACERKMMARGKSKKSADAICASIGRKKYGAKRMAQMAAAGRRKKR